MDKGVQDYNTRRNEFLRHMDKDGFFPPYPCLQCNKELQGQGSGRPAELYAGTFTGLCTSCTNAPAFLIEPEKPVEGAWYWSYPPMNPSYNRARTQHMGFDNCSVCHGQGMTRQGHTRLQCQNCLRRAAELGKESLNKGED